MVEKSNNKKKKKKKDSIIEAQVMAILEQSLKAALNAAMKDLLSNLK